MAAVPGLETAAAVLDARYLDQGFSTAAEGDIAVDLLYVAAGKTFEDLRKHVRIVEVSGESVAALDIDGMLATKQTDRATDIPDRQRLERLKAEIEGKPRRPRPG